MIWSSIQRKFHWIVWNTTDNQWNELYVYKIRLESGQDGEAERPWVRFLSRLHKNHNCLQNNRWWKRWGSQKRSSTMKDIEKELQQGGQEKQTRYIIKFHPPAGGYPQTRE